MHALRELHACQRRTPMRCIPYESYTPMRAVYLCELRTYKRHVSHRRASLIDHLVGVPLTGMHLIDVLPSEAIP
jgi:hypothetical protein